MLCKTWWQVLFFKSIFTDNIVTNFWNVEIYTIPNKIENLSDFFTTALIVHKLLYAEVNLPAKLGNTIDSGFQVGMCSRKTCMSTPICESVIKGLSNGLSTIIRI